MANSILIFLYMLSIVAGVGVGYWLGVRDVKEADEKDPEHAPHFIESRRQIVARKVGWGVIALLVAFTVTQAYASVARDRQQVEVNSEQVRHQAECNAAFLDTLETRSRLNKEDQDLDRDDSRQIRKALRSYLLPPPPGYTVESWQAEITRQLEESLQANDDARTENEKEREKNPARPPECRDLVIPE